MFSSKRLRELENTEKWLRQRVDVAEAAAAKKQSDDYENRSWVEQGKGTNIKTLVVNGGQLLRLEDGRTFFLPTMHTYYGGNAGYTGAVAQPIIPLG